MVSVCHSVLGEWVVQREVPSVDVVVGVALWWCWEVLQKADLTELQAQVRQIILLNTFLKNQ